MKPGFLHFFLFSLLFLNSANAYAQTWQLEGPDDSNQPAFNTAEVHMVSDKTGGIYLAYRDWYFGQAKASVRHWDGTTWAQTGNAYFSTGAIDYIKMALAPNDQPYVVYKDFTAGGKAVVKTFSNGAWSDIGTYVSVGGAKYTTIAVDGSGIPYVAYADSLQNDKLTVRRWSGTSWDLVGTAGFTPASSSNFKIVFDGANVPFVLAVYYNGTATPCDVYKFSGGSWNAVGTAGNTNLEYNRSVTTADLTIDDNDTLYVAYADNNNSLLARVKKFDGTNWVNVGQNSLSPGRATRVQIEIDTFNSIYMSCASSYDPGNYAPEYGVVRHFDGTSWSRVGVDSFVLKSRMTIPTMALDTSGTPALLFIGQEGFRKIQVRKFDGIDFNLFLGTTTGLTNSPAELFLFSGATSPNGDNAYITTAAYNNSNFDSAKVIRYDNGAWTLIGQSDPSHWSGAIVDVAVHPNGQPWIVVAGTNSQYSIWRYDGANWINTNKPGTQNGGPASLCFDDAGNAYFAHQAYTVGLYTMKYTPSGGWQNTGSPLPSNASFAFIRMKTDRNGVPHLLGGIHGSQNQYAFGIYRYSNGSWTTNSVIGTINSGFGVPSGSTPDFAFDTANEIYSTLINTSPRGIAVLKHNTITHTYVNVGTTLTAIQQGQYPRIQFAADGTLYLFYSDNSTKPLGPTSVNKLDVNNNWVPVGNTSFTMSYTQTPQLFILNNMLVSAYIDGAVYAHKYNCSQAVTISQQPAHTPVCKDSAASISVIATGATGYQWQYFDGFQWRFVSNNTTYSGAQTAVLAITAAQLSMNGYQYRCIVKTACDLPVISEAGTLMVEDPSLQPPSVAIAADTTSICAGASVRVIAHVVNAGVVGQYTWKHNGVTIPVPNDSVLNIATIANGDIITCDYTRTSLCGNASSTVVSNSLSFVVASAQTSTVNITANPGTTISAGQSVTFTANVINPGISQSYQWYLNSAAVSGATNSTYTTNTLNNGDQVYVTVTRADTCVSILTAQAAPLTMTVITDVREVKNFRSAIVVYPQPAKDHILIKNDERLPAGNYICRLYSLTGALIFSEELLIDGRKTDYKVKLPEQLPNGNYRLIINGTKLTMSAAISIMH